MAPEYSISYRLRVCQLRQANIGEQNRTAQLEPISQFYLNRMRHPNQTLHTRLLDNIYPIPNSMFKEKSLCVTSTGTSFVSSKMNWCR
jgi:hypothetical protein